MAYDPREPVAKPKSFTLLQPFSKIRRRRRRRWGPRPQTPRTPERQSQQRPEAPESRVSMARGNDPKTDTEVPGDWTEPEAGGATHVSMIVAPRTAPHHATLSTRQRFSSIA